MVSSAKEEQVEPVAKGWAGVDVGKGHPWVCLIDEGGTILWSSKVVNDETAILEAISEVRARAERVTWAVDVTGTMSGLLLALLAAHKETFKYVPGRIVNTMAGSYRGEAKTDARDAYVIAESVRQRGDLTEVEVSATLVADLRLLVTHRTDLVAGRVRLINRLRDVLCGYFPALERAFDYAHSRGALVLLTRYQTPAAIRRIGKSRLQAWLAKRKVRSAEQIDTDAVAAAASTPSSRDRTWPRRSWAIWPPTYWHSTSGSRTSTFGSRAPSEPTRKPRSSSRCPAWGRSSAPSSSPQRAISTAMPAPAGSPQPQDSFPCHGTRVDAPGTCTARCATPASYVGCSTCLPTPR